MTPITTQHIELVPSANHGQKAVIAGTRIRVVDVYAWIEIHGRTPREIVEDFSQLTLGDVHAAMAYYWDNKELLDEQMREADEYAKKMEKLYPSLIPAALERMGKTREELSRELREGTDGDQVSS